MKISMLMISLVSSAFAGDHGLARGGMRKSSAAMADSATKLSADEPGEAEHDLTYH